MDLLPEPDAALAPLKHMVVETIDGPTDEARKDLSVQMVQLSQIFAGRSELELLHAACISYLRRATQQTAKARVLFHRIWAEEADFLLERLPARWLVSTLQTFYDHPATPGERTAGGVGFMYGNLIKVYETERAASRPRPPDSPYPYSPQLRAVEGMGGFKPGDDVLANINVLAYDAALDGGPAGRVLLRLMEIVRDGDTIFRRTDELRHLPAFRDRRLYTLSFDGTDPLAEPQPG